MWAMQSHGYHNRTTLKNIVIYFAQSNRRVQLKKNNQLKNNNQFVRGGRLDFFDFGPLPGKRGHFGEKVIESDVFRFFCFLHHFFTKMAAFAPA